MSVIALGLLMMGVTGTAMRIGTNNNRGAIYARYSSRFQHSIQDQVRKCQEWAASNGITVLDEHIYTDEAKTGRTHRRKGLQALLDALAHNDVDVVIIFATNRLYRKVYRALQFVEEEIDDRRKRCVFVMQKIDTNEKAFWRQLLNFAAMIDEWQSQMNVGFIRSAHEGLVLNELVHGTLAFGYCGVEIEGRMTRRGLPPRKLDICPKRSPWVLKMFRWFVVDQLSMSAIARRLNREGAPPPPKSPKRRWTARSVKVAFENRRYIGDWSYGWSESVFQNRAGYVRQFKQEKPRRQHEIPRLRLIEDTLFLQAQQRLAKYEGRGGRPKGCNPQDTGPDPLHELLWCPQHERYLIAVTDKHMVCPDCKQANTPHLYSVVNRVLAIQLICQRLAQLIKADTTLVNKAMGVCRRVIESSQQPDELEPRRLQKRVESLTTDIRFIMESPGDTETDRAENAGHLRRLRAERSEIELRIKMFEAEQSRPKCMPSDNEVKQLVDRTVQILEEASTSQDEQVLAAARRVIHQITGGRVLMDQQGERKPKLGWLRGTFQVRVVKPVLEELGVKDDVNGSKFQIDFKPVGMHVKIADEAKVLLDQDDPALDVKEIAVELSKRYGETISRNMVSKALKHWFSSRGMEVPDFRKRRAELGKLPFDAAIYNDKSIVDKVMVLFQRGRLYAEIADDIGINPCTVAKIVGIWHKEQEIPVPDGRTRRRFLKNKNRDRKGHDGKAN